MITTKDGTTIVLGKVSYVGPVKGRGEFTGYDVYFADGKVAVSVFESDIDRDTFVYLLSNVESLEALAFVYQPQVVGTVEYFKDLPTVATKGDIYKVSNRTANYFTLGVSSRYVDGYYEALTDDPIRDLSGWELKVV